MCKQRTISCTTRRLPVRLRSENWLLVALRLSHGPVSAHVFGATFSVTLTRAHSRSSSSATSGPPNRGGRDRRNRTACRPSRGRARSGSSPEHERPRLSRTCRAAVQPRAVGLMGRSVPPHRLRCDGAHRSTRHQASPIGPALAAGENRAGGVGSLASDTEEFGSPSAPMTGPGRMLSVRLEVRIPATSAKRASDPSGPAIPGGLLQSLQELSAWDSPPSRSGSG
jgi:hypothetical protein